MHMYAARVVAGSHYSWSTFAVVSWKILENVLQRYQPSNAVLTDGRLSLRINWVICDIESLRWDLSTQVEVSEFYVQSTYFSRTLLERTSKKDPDLNPAELGTDPQQKHAQYTHGIGKANT